VSKSSEASETPPRGRRLPQPTVDSIDLTNVLSALADPVRLEIMRGLYANGEPIDCAAIASRMPVTASTVSHHWRVLREAGLTSTVADHPGPRGRPRTTLPRPAQGGAVAAVGLSGRGPGSPDTCRLTTRSANPT
jgi:DNA-binding transcriptional ArsR family regulator